MSLRALFLLSSYVGAIYGLPSPNPHKRTGGAPCSYQVDNLGTFTHHVQYSFTGTTTLPSDLNVTWNNQITDKDHGAPYNHVFLASNVAVANGYLQIKVPGGQTPATAPNNAITAGEVFTKEPNILYASVRTRAIFSTVPGTCSGSFFYKTDTQEIDLEFLSDPRSEGNTNNQPGLHFTNQPTHGGSSTTRSVPFTGGSEHEYRIDWVSGRTDFYVDGTLQTSLTDNVPSVPGRWLWNNWANGDLEWSAGPPANDNVLKISSIEMYYNVSGSSVASCST